MGDEVKPTCKLCGEPMPEGEEMFCYHGYSGPCPKSPLTKPSEPAPAQPVSAAISCLVCGHQKERCIVHEPSGQYVCFDCRDAIQQNAALREELKRLRLRAFYRNPDKEHISHTTACTIWRDDGQGNAPEFPGDSCGPCNCGCLENFERKRAEAAEAELAKVPKPRCPKCGSSKLVQRGTLMISCQECPFYTDLSLRNLWQLFAKRKLPSAEELARRFVQMQGIPDFYMSSIVKEAEKWLAALQEGE